MVTCFIWRDRFWEPTRDGGSAGRTPSWTNLSRLCGRYRGHPPVYDAQRRITTAIDGATKDLASLGAPPIHRAVGLML